MAAPAGALLALFFGSFTIVYGSFGVIGDLFPGFLSWGYTFGLIALAAMVVRAADLRPRAHATAGSPGGPGCSARSRACCTRGTARC